MQGNVREQILSELDSLCIEERIDPEDVLKAESLLESGLDSMAFAVLVARLENIFGWDPFEKSDVPIYPQTFSEFVSVYENYQTSSD